MKRPVLASTIVLFAIMVAYSLLETARDALLLAELGPDALALAYVAIAACALVAMMLVRRWARARQPRRMLVTFLAIGSAGTGALGQAMGTVPSLAFVLYVWTGLLATLIVPSFWLVLQRRVPITEAKRTFGFVAAGGGFGALVGSACAALLARAVDPRHLVTVAALAMLLATVLAALLAPTSVAEPAPPPARIATGTATRHALRYVRLLLLLGVVSTVTLTLGDLMFKRLLAERLPAGDLAPTFGAIYTGLNVIGLVVQLVVTARLLERAGVGAALTILPVLLLASALGFVLTGATLAVIAFKLADGGLRHAVHRVATEILFLPLSPAMRDSAKPTIDALGQRGGQALAAVIAMTLATDARVLAIVTTSCVALWLVALGFTRGAYVRQFRARLEAGDIQRDVELPTLDRSSVAMLMSALASPDEAEAAAALDLLALHEDIPALVLYHPSPAIVRRALASLGGTLRPDVVRVLEHLATHGDPQIRAAAIAASSRTGHPAQCLGEALDDPEPDVRAAAAVALFGRFPAGPGRAAVAALAAGTTAERAALARAISRDPRHELREVLVQLLARREPSVVSEVVHAWQQAPVLADPERLLLLLAHPHVRGHVRRTLVALGDLEPLIAALDDPRTPLAVRRHLPRTISRFRSPVSAAALVARLAREPDGTTEFKILRALGRMRADDPALPIDEDRVRHYARRTLEDAGRYRRLRRGLDMAEWSPTIDLLDELLVEKRRHAIERAFRALGIVHPRANLRSVHDAITGGDDEHRAAAREILDELLPAEDRGRILDELEERDRPAADVYASPDEAIRALITDPSDSLRCIAAHHVAQRRLVTLRAELVRMKPLTGSPFVTIAFEQAIESLDA